MEHTLTAAVTGDVAAESALCRVLDLEARMSMQAPLWGAYISELLLHNELVRAAALLESARAGDACDAGAWFSKALVFEAEGNHNRASEEALRRAVVCGRHLSWT